MMQAKFRADDVDTGGGPTTRVAESRDLAETHARPGLDWTKKQGLTQAKSGQKGETVRHSREESCGYGIPCHWFCRPGEKGKKEGRKGAILSVLCLFMAYQFIPPATAEAVWNASMPVFVVTLSCIFLQQIPTRVTIIGSTCCVGGVVLLSYGSFVNMTSSSKTTDVTLGQILAVTGALIHSMLDVGAKSILEITPRTMSVMYTYAISSLSAGIGAFVTSTTWHLEPVTVTVLVLSCCSHGLGILFFYLGLKLVEVNAVTALIQLSAFSAYGLQWAMLGFAPTVLDGLGLTCVLLGAFSIVIWEAIGSWKEQKRSALIEQLGFNVTKPNDKP
uniref:EamA domain-containing protein n=1 Tax=Branchiostoma floridae TaxID=7739 RepID=C3Y6L2_BRAFL|eukprot:XP_002607962.1 hypothetical protein BRAFLDRAFT_74911 [Branchiostoma floridae]